MARGRVRGRARVRGRGRLRVRGRVRARGRAAHCLASAIVGTAGGMCRRSSTAAACTVSFRLRPGKG